MIGERRDFPGQRTGLFELYGEFASRVANEPPSTAKGLPMIMPRFRIAWVMVFVAVAALNLTVFRAAEDLPFNTSRTVGGCHADGECPGHRPHLRLPVAWKSPIPPGFRVVRVDGVGLLRGPGGLVLP